MSIYEYDMEKHMRMERADAREEGIEEGRNALLKEQIQKNSKKGNPRRR